MQLPDEPQQVHSRLNAEDTERCQRAIQLANTGDKQLAYQIFCNLQRTNPEDTTVLTWISYTTPSIDEAQRAIATIEQLEPGHPNLGMLRSRVSKMQPRAEYVSPIQYTQPKIKCPYCGHRGTPLTIKKISTGGWITVVVLLFVFFPLCWVGLFIKKDVYVCANCGIEMGNILAY